jgi:hypothetical protein
LYAKKGANMFITRKNFKALEKRIADLEGQVQGQQKTFDAKIDIKSFKNAFNQTLRETGKSIFTI